MTLIVGDEFKKIKGLFEQSLEKVRANGYLSGESVHVPQCEWMTSRRTLGQAYSYHNRIRLSKNFWPILTEEQKTSTILHEIAHLFADWAFSRRCKHNADWQEIARIVGTRATARCPDALTPIGYYEAFCNCGRQVSLSPFKHRNRQSYGCRYCKTNLGTLIFRKIEEGQNDSRSLLYQTS